MWGRGGVESIGGVCALLTFGGILRTMWWVLMVAKVTVMSGKW